MVADIEELEIFGSQPLDTLQRKKHQAPDMM